MIKTLRIAWREYTESVRTKAFFIGIVVAPILMSGSIIAMVLFENVKDVSEKTLAVIDHSGRIGEALAEKARERNEKWIRDEETGEQVRPTYLVELLPPAEDLSRLRAELSDRVRERKLAAFVELGDQLVDPGEDPAGTKFTYHSENPVMDDMRGWVRNAVNDVILEELAAEVGIGADVSRRILRWMDVSPEGLYEVDPVTGEVIDAKPSNEGLAFGVPFGLAMLLFVMIMMGAMPLLHATLEEKTQRIAEVLLGSARPFELIFGKLLGNLGVSLTAASVYLGGALLTCYYKGVMEYVPLELIPWFLVYMAAAIAMCGAGCIAVGAACNDAKEVQSLMLPIMLPFMLPMFVLVPVIKEPLGAFATWLSLFPPCTPMLMLLRQAGPATIPAWQPWVGLAGILVTSVLCVWAGGRIFRVGLLMQGKPPKPADLLRWAIRG